MRRPILSTALLLAAAGAAAAQFPLRQPPTALTQGFPGDPRFGPAPFAPGAVPVTQLRSLQSGEFLYTNDPQEANTLAAQGTHQVEGTAFSVLPRRTPGMRALVRYIRGNGTHFLATSRQPARPEMTLGYVYTQPVPGSVPLITWHNPQASQDFYTTDPNNLQPAQLGFQRADVLGYVLP